MPTFKEKYSFETRKGEVDRIQAKYPGKIPVVVEKNAKSSIADIDKHKYLIPSDLTVGQFIFVIRKRLKLKPEEAIFIFINNTLVPTSMPMTAVYTQHKEEDGFLYVTYSGESTFG